MKDANVKAAVVGKKPIWMAGLEVPVSCGYNWTDEHCFEETIRYGPSNVNILSMAIWRKRQLEQPFELEVENRQYDRGIKPFATRFRMWVPE